MMLGGLAQSRISSSAAFLITPKYRRSTKQVSAAPACGGVELGLF
jgi:hypothetical protein